MTASLFAFLETIGFTHPLHPAFTHIPMSMVMGCCIFSLLAWKLNRDDLNRTALHCALLALLFIGPTVVAGLLDWQHRYGGLYHPLIVIKMVLAPILTGLLVYAALEHRKNAAAKKIFALYFLCLFCAVGLGFAGGELVYGN